MSTPSPTLGVNEKYRGRNETVPPLPPDPRESAEQSGRNSENPPRPAKSGAAGDKPRFRRRPVYDSDQLTRALYYARVMGWRVFPCYSATGLPPNLWCTCKRGHDCPNPGKHPQTRHGLKDATRDEKQIRSWWRKDPTANVAVATGDGLVVIDVDAKSGGLETLAALEAEFGPLPRNLAVRTGGGGLHFYLSLPAGIRIGSQNGWQKGIDIKGEGGYVIAPPSNHASGRTYEWEAAA